MKSTDQSHGKGIRVLAAAQVLVARERRHQPAFFARGPAAEAYLAEESAREAKEKEASLIKLEMINDALAAQKIQHASAMARAKKAAPRTK